MSGPSSVAVSPRLHDSLTPDGQTGGTVGDGFADLLRLYAGREDREPGHVASLAAAFFDAVSSSNRFSWMGLTRCQDELGRTRVGVYLLEHSAQMAGRLDGARSAASIAYLFDRLALAVRSHLLLDLYYLDGSRCSCEDAEQRLRDACATDPPHREVVWSTAMQPLPVSAV